MFELTGFQRDLLYIIADLDEPSGQDIKGAMEEFVGEVSHSRLYPNLDVLVNRDLVEKGQINRRTNYYQITATGEEAIRERREWEDEVTDFLE